MREEKRCNERGRDEGVRAAPSCWFPSRGPDLIWGRGKLDTVGEITSFFFFFFFESRKLVALSDMAFVGREEWINRTFFQDIGGRRIKLL